MLEHQNIFALHKQNLKRLSLEPLDQLVHTCRASDFFKFGGPKRPMEQKMVGHFLK